MRRGKASWMSHHLAAVIVNARRLLFVFTTAALLFGPSTILTHLTVVSFTLIAGFHIGAGEGEEQALIGKNITCSSCDPAVTSRASMNKNAEKIRIMIITYRGKQQE